MLIIALPLALIAIVFGMKLLAQTKKDNLGNLFKYVSWFVIVMGFLVTLCIGCRAVMRHCCHGGEHEMMMKKRCMMMDDDNCYMGHMGGCSNMNMMGCHHMMGGCCGGMMMMHGGCGNMGGGCCNMDNDCDGGQCHDGMKSCCKDGDKGCKEDDDKGSCPMMKGDKKDSSCCKKK